MTLHISLADEPAPALRRLRLPRMLMSAMPRSVVDQVKRCFDAHDMEMG